MLVDQKLSVMINMGINFQKYHPLFYHVKHFVGIQIAIMSLTVDSKSISGVIFFRVRANNSTETN